MSVLCDKETSLIFDILLKIVQFSNVHILAF